MRRSMFLLVGLIVAIAQSIAPTATPAQERGASGHRLRGSVRDTLGRPLPRVEVTLQAADGHVVATAKSNDQGEFSFPDVAPGTYAAVGHKATFKTATAIVAVTSTGAKPVTLAMASEEALSLAVVAKRLEAARNGLSPETGSSVYRFNEKAIHDLPQGTNSQMSEVLLQAPGVAQDSFGQLHIRGEHAEIQYRINGIELPEGIAAGFSQTLSPRLAQSVSLLEGALPAQYGYHTAGVVQIQTKSGDSLNAGNIDMYGGQRYTLQPSFELGGSKGNFSYYATGFYLQNSRGLEPPTPGPQAQHDFATIGNGFTYLSYFLNATTRLSFIGGFNLSNFQIPSNPGQTPAFKLAGVSPEPSQDITETQLEQNYYGVIALQGLLAKDLDYQIAAFTRYSTLSFHPDQNGDLIYNGEASRAFRGDFANGLQGDFAYRAIAQHTFRAGFYFTGERAEIDNHALVFPGSAAGQCTGPHSPPCDQAFAVVDNHALTQWLYGIYLQDEWRPIEKLTINYGARFDLYDGLTRADQVSPRVGLVYQLFEQTALHAAYARYFTPPPLEAVSGADVSKFAGTTGAPAVFGGFNIAPERAHYFDVGVTQNLPYGLKVDLDSYYKKSTDLIDEGQFGPTLIFTPFNYAKGRQYGVEFTTSMNWKNFSAYTNFAYSVAQGTKLESDQFLFGADEIAYISHHYIFLDHDQTFSASGGTAYTWKGFLFTLDGLYGSGLRTGFANTGNQPFYIQFNAGIAKSLTVPKIGKLEARLAVINLGDWIYQIRSGSGIGVFAPQYGPRRTFYGGLKWDIPFLSGRGNGAS
jgi:outer membrane receptor protein involved in Fe transport